MNARQIDCQDQTINQRGRQRSRSSKGLRRQRVKAIPGGGQIESDQYLRASAREKAQHGDYTAAIAILTHLIDRNPDDAVDYNNRGLIYFESGQMEKAIADYNRALELNPNLDSVYNNRANYYAAKGQLAEALADYEKAIDLNVVNIRAWINLGITFRQLELYDLALENFDLALILGQLEGHIYAERGRTYHLRGDWNGAIADYRRALIKLPQFGSALRLQLQVETWLNELLEN